jgi:DNA-binding HxlR family transcriptional regulator
VNRPGAIEKSAAGLTAKVLCERLDKRVRFGIVEKQSFPRVPPRVEYSCTPFGKRFLKLIEEVEQLEREFASTRKQL